MSLHIDNVILPGNEKSFTIGSRTQATSFNDLHPFFRALLYKPVTASVATINVDGRPQLTPNWCTYDGTYLYLNSVRDRLKDRNIRARPDVTVMLMNPENPYHWMTIYGVVEQIIEEDDPQAEVRVLYKVRPTQIVTFGSLPTDE